MKTDRVRPQNYILVQCAFNDFSLQVEFWKIPILKDFGEFTIPMAIIGMTIVEAFEIQTMLKSVSVLPELRGTLN